MIRWLLLFVFLTSCASQISAPKSAPPPPLPPNLPIGMIVSTPVGYQFKDGKAVCMDVVGFGFSQFTESVKNCLCLTEVHLTPGGQTLQQRIVLAAEIMCHPSTGKLPSTQKGAAFQL